MARAFKFSGHFLIFNSLVKLLMCGHLPSETNTNSS